MLVAEKHLCSIWYTESQPDFLMKIRLMTNAWNVRKIKKD